jgi:hypothetical protein
MRSYEEFNDADRGHRAPPSSRQQDTTASPHLVASRLAAPEAVLSLQRAAGNAAVARLISSEGLADEERSPVLDVVGKGGGQPLESDVQARMERRFGADLADVRVHTGQQAAASAASVQAHAYTVGNEIVFNQGHYDPASPAGDRVLAHELTHVLQQRSGPVEGTPVGGGIALSDPDDRFEQAAESTADRVTSAAPAVQRQEDEGEEVDEEAAVQGLFVQRQDDGGEEFEDEEEAAG